MKYTNKYNLPGILFRALTRNDHKQEGKYSVSSLINPVRLEALRKRHDDEIEKDASENLWALLGTAIHKVVEMGGGSGDIVEQHLCIEVEGVKISGTPDHIDMDSMVLNDWKCTSIWTYIFGGRSEWEQALNVYRWMIYRKLGILMERMFNMMIFRDHSKRDAGLKPDYPPVPFAAIEQDCWEIEQTEAFVIERLQAHEAAEGLSDEDLPPCTPEERWQKEDQWKVYKKPGAPKAERGGTYTRFTHDEPAKSAEEHAASIGGVTVFLPGKSVRCGEYCDVSPFCSQYKLIKEMEENA